MPLAPDPTWTARLRRLHEAANTAMSGGQWDAAARLIEQILVITPRSATAHANLAAAQDRLGRPAAALESLARAISIAPDDRLARGNRGDLLHRLGQFQAALADFDHVLRRHPDDADTRLRRASTWYALGNLPAALVDLRAAASLRPAHVGTLANLGLVLETAGCLEEALACCDQALAIDPADCAAMLNRGVVLGRMRRWEEALACFDAVTAARPDDANAQYNASLIHLAQGDYPTGWRRHEWRWQAPHLRRAARGFAQPLWRGEVIGPQRTLLLHAEQGLGDTLQFCRYVPLVARQADVVLEVPQPLHRLLSRLPGVRATVVQGDPLPRFDQQCPLLSLPLAFATTVDTVPAEVPYLTADPLAVDAWRQRLAALPGRKVGLAWAGRAREGDPAMQAIDRRRSVALAEFAPLAAVPGVTFVSLQKGPAAEQARTAPGGLVVQDWTAELADFADTAALAAALDLVISVDTAVAHLAGALGKPVWVLNRFDACWRWLEGRSDSPWYPSARLFRQTAAGDWAGVIEEVGDALRAPPRQVRGVRRTPVPRDA